jgi:hypothetical protein
MDGYIYITHLPLFPKMYIIEYTFSHTFDEANIVRNCFNLDYVKRIKNVDYVYTNLLNSPHLLQNKFSIEINGMNYNLYQLLISIENLDNLFYVNECVDIYWNKKLIKYRFQNSNEYRTIENDINITKDIENMSIL